MTDDFADLSETGYIPDFVIDLPKTNIKQYLFDEGIVESIEEPKKFQKGLIVVAGSNNGLIILIKSAKGFKDIKEMFLKESVEWLLINK